jgi:hypothetical protein
VYRRHRKGRDAYSGKWGNFWLRLRCFVLGHNMKIVIEQRPWIEPRSHTYGHWDWHGFQCRRCGREEGFFDDSYMPDIKVKLWLR